MKIFQLYLKIFLVSSVLFGTPIIIMFWFLRDAPWAGVAAGIIFGFFISIFGTHRHIKMVRDLPYGKTEDALDVRHERSVSLSLPYDQMFDLCNKSLKLIENCNIVEKNLAKGKILAKISTKRSLSYTLSGKEISFDLKRISDMSTQAQVYIKPTSPLLLIDYGENLQVIETIINFLKERPAAEPRTSDILTLESLKQGRVLQGEEEVNFYIILEVAMTLFVLAAAAFILLTSTSLPLSFKLIIPSVILLRLPVFFLTIKPWLIKTKGAARHVIFWVWASLSYPLVIIISILLIIASA